MGKKHYGWVILALAVLTIMGALGFGRFGYTVILPPMREALALTDSEAGALATGNMIGYLTISLVSGFIAVRIGRRRMIGAALLIGAAGMTFTGFSSSFGAAFAGRLVTGMASAAANVPVMALLSAWFAKRRRGFASGLAVGGSSLGLLLTGLLLPWIMRASDNAGWRTGWFALAGATALIALFVIIFLRDKPEEKGLSAIGATKGGGEDEDGGGRLETGRADRSRNGHERKERALNVILRNRAVRSLAAIYFCYGFSYLIFSTFYVRFLVAEGGFSLASASFLWALIGAVSFSSGFAWGAFSDRFGRGLAFVIGFTLLTACFFVFGFWITLPGFIVASILFAGTAWSVVGIMAAAVGDAVGSTLAPQAFGMVTFTLGIGQAIGPLFGGMIKDATGSFSGAFYLASAVAALGILLSIIFSRGARKRDGKPGSRGSHKEMTWRKKAFYRMGLPLRSDRIRRRWRQRASFISRGNSD